MSASNAAREWSVSDASRLYRIPRWSGGYYRVTPDGHIGVLPHGTKTHEIDLRLLMDELAQRNIHPPVLIRFMDILSDRIRRLRRCFQRSCREYGYEGAYHPVYPIKVNQQRQVVEAMMRAGSRHSLGLEVGSKPELLAVLALAPANDSLIICNGCKDAEFIELALRAGVLGNHVVLVAEKYTELLRVLTVAEAVGVRPSLGLRLKLGTRGEGRWADSAGDASKFGLRLPELMQAIRALEERGLSDCFELLHVHFGSQISQIGRLRRAMAEMARTYAELCRLGLRVRYVDVGGGLGIDYEGTASASSFSTNYSLQEYANDIVFPLKQVCDAEDLPHPGIITESGRALTAHYSVLVTNVLDWSIPGTAALGPLPDECTPQLTEIYTLYRDLTHDNTRETFHDAVYLRNEALNLYNLGYMPIEERSLFEEAYWAIMGRVHVLARKPRLRHREFAALDAQLSAICFANFSLFQSLPDSWAIDQPFPIVPIQRLDERPQRNCTLADITCDSDGHIGHYVSTHENPRLLPLHDAQADTPYYVGFFLIGAYQEILGDLHNLFGDTNAVHVVMDRKGKHHISHYIRGDSVADVLSYLEYQTRELTERMRSKAEHAVQQHLLSVEAAAEFLRLYETGLAGYTYLED